MGFKLYVDGDLWFETISLQDSFENISFERILPLEPGAHVIFVEDNFGRFNKGIAVIVDSVNAYHNLSINYVYAPDHRKQFNTILNSRVSQKLKLLPHTRQDSLDLWQTERIKLYDQKDRILMEPTERGFKLTWGYAIKTKDDE
ncbi:MAG: hypothetical protein N4A46_00755 [Schleiferiaceae bacterium]|nr:hypothetical protein [Schleiferiaceae bacterium]